MKKQNKARFSLGLAWVALALLSCSGTDDNTPSSGDPGNGNESGQGGAAGMLLVDSGTGGTTFDSGSSGETVTLSGRVMAPSGAFPISGALVFLTRGEVQQIPDGVYHYECDDMSGKPYTLSRADGTWTIENAPTGTWKLVTRKGNFRRIREIEITEDMDGNVDETMTTLPGERSSDGLDMIPKFAVVKTDPDLTYNLLAKFGMGDVDASGELVTGTESFYIYDDEGSGAHPHTSALFDSQSELNSYHMIFLPCNSSSVGVNFVRNHAQMLRDYASAGGRIYNSCTVSLWSEAAFPDYIDFYQSDDLVSFDIGRRTNTSYTTSGQLLDHDLSAWMSLVTSHDPNHIPFYNGYVTIDSTQDVNDGHGLEKDNGIVKPYTWVKDNGSYPGSPLMITYNYDYGKVFYSVYETSSHSTEITPQEYVLLYVILEVGVCANPPPVVK